VLAYVFAHRPAPGGDVAAYEDVLREFHQMLASSRLAGFVSSSTYRIGDGYSDWYLVESSAALDALNEAAVTGARAASHHAAARMAVDGVGKLLSLAGGQVAPAAAVEARFAKPPGMAYDDLYASLEPLTASAGCALWRRMMVLGPPPEFCLTCPARVDLPPAIRAEVLHRTPI
jgi:hypothetical protein